MPCRKRVDLEEETPIKNLARSQISLVPSYVGKSPLRHAPAPRLSEL